MSRWWGRHRRELRCEEVASLLQGHLDGELDELRARIVARHLEDCRRCGLEADTYAAIKASLRRGAPPPPQAAVKRLHDFVQRLAGGELGPPEEAG